MKKFLLTWILSPGIAKLFVKLLSAIKPSGSQPPRKKEKTFDLSLDVVLTDGWLDFRNLVSESTCYAEYGSGESTLYVSEASTSPIRSIETDPKWVDLVRGKLPRRGEIVRVDLGPTGRWGRPDTFDQADQFMTYISAPFAGGYSPDLVLIDGRFRVACFLYSVLHSAPGTKIVFDDYVTRPFYHIAETVVPADKIGPRQAIFTRPEKIDDSRVRFLLDKFEYVMD